MCCSTMYRLCRIFLKSTSKLKLNTTFTLNLITALASALSVTLGVSASTVFIHKSKSNIIAISNV